MSYIEHDTAREIRSYSFKVQLSAVSSGHLAARPHSVIVLTPQAAAGLRARFIRDPQLDHEQRLDQRHSPSPQDQIENNSVVVREVKVLENGWVHAYMTFSTSRSTRERVDLLLPMQDVVAIYSDTTVTNNVLDDQMNDGYRRETTRRDEAFQQE